jgi:Leucine-rich repeat (LRR) protein
VFSLRANRLLYLPEEISRISKLRVLNLSSNNLRLLPYSISKLRELQALWLAENQTKPLIPLQQEKDKSGKRFLTCYLFPQEQPHITYE